MMGSIRRWFRIALRVYLIACGFLVAGCVLVLFLNGFLGSRTVHTHEVLGYAVRPSAQGPMRTVIVGERTSPIPGRGDTPMVHGEVQVDDLDKHPVGSSVTYSCWIPWIFGERGWGRLVQE